MADFKATKPTKVGGKHRAGKRPVNLLKTNTFLPEVFQTPLNKKWLDATLDKMVSKGDLEDIDAFVGSTSGSALGKWNDYYLNTNTSHKQLQPAIITSNDDKTLKNAITIDDVAKNINYNFDTYSYNNAYNTQSYVYAPPIDIDKFVNYRMYYWIPVMYPILFELASGTNVNPIDDLTGLPTGEITDDNGTVTLYDGMKVLFIGAGWDPSIIIGREWIVTGVGDKIVFKDPVGWNTDNILYTNTVDGVNLPLETKDYIVINRSDSANNVSGTDSAWSRGNHWVHRAAIEHMIEWYPGLSYEDYINSTTQAKRPIIEFDANITMMAGQTKATPNQAPLFRLKHASGTWLDAYNSSNFVGNKLFGYKVATTGTADTELDFVPVFKDIGSKSEMVFVNELSQTEYTYLEDQSNLSNKLRGLYYYERNGVPHNNYIASSYTAGAKDTVQVIANNDADVSIPIGYLSWRKDPFKSFVVSTDDGKIVASSITKEGDANRNNIKQNELFVAAGTSCGFYDLIGTGTLKFYDSSGVDITPTPSMTNVFPPIGLSLGSAVNIPATAGSVIYFGTSFANSSRIYAVDSADAPFHKLQINGKTINESNYTISPTTITVPKALLTSEKSIIDLEYYNKAEKTTKDVQVPDVHSNNTKNIQISEFTQSETLAHWTSIIENTPGFTGDSFGNNNYASTIHAKGHGGEIFMHNDINIMHDLCYGDDKLNITTALSDQGNDWWVFRQRFISQVKRLYGTKSYSDVRSLVIDVLASTTASRKGTDLHKNSNMAFSKPNNIKTHNTNVAGKYSLGHGFNTDNFKQDHVYVYLTDNRDSDNVAVKRILTQGTDYTIADGQVVVTATVTAFTDTQKTTIGIDYNSMDDDSYVPASMVKLGLASIYKPQVHNNQLIGHDGSTYDVSATAELHKIQSANFDPVAACLFDLENRIWSGTKVQTQSTTSALNYLPNEQVGTWYTRSKVDSYIKSEFLDWYTKTKQTTLTPTGYYDASDPFTWNYSEVSLANYAGWNVSNFPGHYTGAYALIFGTHTPHLTPWHMLGYSFKPTWWDTYYSWTDATKRAALINALQYGIINNPGEASVQNVNYATWSWDWSSRCPVKTDGTLDDPDNILVNPGGGLFFGTGKSAPFVFGDWGPTELLWRTSSLGQSALVNAVLKLNPAKAWTDFFQPYTFADNFIGTFKLHTSNFAPISNTKLAYHTQVNNRNVAKVTVKNSSGTFPVGTTINFAGGTDGLDATGTLDLDSSGNAVGVSLTFRGNGYTSRPNIQFVWPVVTAGAFVIGTEYTIVTPGTTNFTLIGAADSDIGTVFTATGVGTGTGTATYIGPSTLPSADFKVTLVDDNNFTLGINNAQVNHFHRNDITSDIVDSYKTVATKLAQPLGGFSSDHLLEVLSESGAAGKFRLSEKDASLSFYGGNSFDLYHASVINIEKTASGYSVAGVSKSRQEFKFNLPLETNNDFTSVTVNSDTSLTKYKNFVTTTSVAEFGTIFARIQDTYNFIRGNYNYMSDSGYTFVGAVGDAKALDFAKWAIGASIGDKYTVPLGTSIGFDRADGVAVAYGSLPGNINSIHALNKAGEIVKINFSDLCIDRDGTKVSIMPRDTISTAKTATAVTTYETIQGAGVVSTPINESIISVETAVTTFEHLLVINNITQFNETIFNDITSERHSRLQLRGQRTRNWKGTTQAPGYLVTGNTIIQNFDTLVEDIQDFYNFDVSKFNTDITKAENYTMSNSYARDWVQTLGLPANTVSQFYKGIIKHKGSKTAIDRIDRTNLVNEGRSKVSMAEEWMLASGHYGDTTRTKATEIKIDTTTLHDKYNVIDLASGSIEFVNNEAIPVFSTSSFSDSPALLTAGEVLATEYDYVAKNLNEMVDVFDSTKAYANVRTWTSSTSYKRNDLVRYKGGLWKCSVPSIGIGAQSLSFNTTNTKGPTNTFTHRNPVSDPSTPSITLDGVDIWFDQKVDTYDNIIENGSITTPTVTFNNTLTVGDGSVGDLITTFNETYDVTSIDDDGILLTGTPNSISYRSNSPTYNGNPHVISSVVTGTIHDVTDKVLLIGTNLLGANRITVPLEGKGTSVAVSTTTEQFSGDGSIVDFTVATPLVIANATDRTISAVRVGGVTKATPADYSVSGQVVTFTVAPPVGTNNVAIDILNPAHITLTAAQLKLAWDSTQLRQNGNDVYLQADVIDNNKTAIWFDAKSSIAAQLIIDGSTPSGKINAAIELGFTPATYTPILKVTATDQPQTLAMVITKLTATHGSTPYTFTDVGNALQIYRSVNHIPTAGAFIIGKWYVISTIGTTDFTLVGAPDSNVGTVFSATGVGTGTGTAKEVFDASVTGSVTDLVISGTALTELGLSATTSHGAATGTINVRPTPAQIVSTITAAGVANTTTTYDGTAFFTISKSTGTQINLGSGEFNTESGLATGVQSISSSPNTFTTAEWGSTNVNDTDTALFNIWLTNDNELPNKITSDITSKYYDWNVQQVQAMPSNGAWADIVAGDQSDQGNDAKLSLKDINDNAIVSNIIAGDYIMIVNSTTVPNIDGIHKVSSVHPTETNSFYIDTFIETSGNAPGIFVLRSSRFNTIADMNKSLTRTAYYNWAEGDMAWTTKNSLNIDSTNVYKYVSGVWTALRTTTERPVNSKIENMHIYDVKTNNVTVEMEVFDPLRGIIPGVAQRELNETNKIDVAVYNNSTDTNYDTTNREYWGEAQIDNTWWDTSTVKYFDYDQSNNEYKSTYWGSQIPGSSIDVYEWTKSTVLPEDWKDAVDNNLQQYGVIATGDAYSVTDSTGEVLYYYTQDDEWNKTFSRYDTVYYFWVKNKTTLSDSTAVAQGRILSVSDIASIINDPTGNGISWCAAISGTAFIVNNITAYINDSSTILQINIKPDGISHNSWTVIAEDLDEIPDYWYIGLDDNLRGTQRGTDLQLPNPAVHVYNRYGDQRKMTHNAKTVAQGWFKDKWDARYEAISIINRLLKNQNLVDNLSTKWHRIISKKWMPSVVTANSSGTTFPTTGGFVGYIFYYETTKVYYTIVGMSALGYDWEQTAGYDMTRTWEYTNYVSPTRVTSQLPSLEITAVTDLSSIDTTKHQVVQFTIPIESDGFDRSEIYQYNIKTSKWELAEKLNATIAFTDFVWNKNGQIAWDMAGWGGLWDPDTAEYVGYIIKACREDLFIEQYKQNFNKLFIGIMKYVTSIHDQVDWLYKTTYIRLNINTDIVTDNSIKKFVRNTVNEVNSYVNAVKPFHTKIRATTDTQNVIESDWNAGFTEHLGINVVTNTSGSTENASTRTYAYLQDNSLDVFAYSLQDNARTTTSGALTTATANIPVVDGTKFSGSGGTAYLNGEIISYTGVSSNTLTGIARGIAETLNRKHESGSVIIDLDGSVLRTITSIRDNASTANFDVATGKSILDGTAVDLDSQDLQGTTRGWNLG